MAARKGRKAKVQVKRLTRGARKGAAKVGKKVARGASKAKAKTTAAFGALKKRFTKSDEEE